MHKIALLSNVTIQPIVQKLKKEYDLYTPSGYDTWVGEVLDSSSGLYAFSPEAIFVLPEGYALKASSVETISKTMELWRSAIDVLATNVSCPVFVGNLHIPAMPQGSFKTQDGGAFLTANWQMAENKLQIAHTNVYFLDTLSLIFQWGYDDFYSDKMWYLGSLPYGKAGIEALTECIKNALLASFAPRKKVLVLDLDNTLYGGVIGEDGVENLVLSSHKEGQAYYDFQCIVKAMKETGVLLAVVSKNNKEDVNALWNHPDMVLKKDDFVKIITNWESKADNVLALSRDLNITLSGFVFADDNPAEREEMKAKLPEVTVFDFPTDVSALPKEAIKLFDKEFRKLSLSGEDITRTEMYRAEEERKEVQKEATSMEDYLKKLSMRVDFHKMEETESDRVAQLVNKTNQFNLTTKRYTKEEIEKLAKASDYAVYVAYLKDSYGDSGLTAVVITRLSEDVVELDSFLMSCRVMGRKFENVLFECIKRTFLEKAKLIRGFFAETSKNAPVKDLYTRFGFLETEKGVFEKPICEIDESKYVDLYEEVVCR